MFQLLYSIIYYKQKLNSFYYDFDQKIIIETSHLIIFFKKNTFMRNIYIQQQKFHFVYRGSVCRWRTILCNKFLIDIRLIKCWKKILSKWNPFIFSWIFGNNIRSSAKRRYFEFLVYSFNINNASLWYWSINKRSWSSIFVAKYE